MYDDSIDIKTNSSTGSDLAKKKILIIGAGCTGCALGQGLKKAGIPYVIYEARDSGKLLREWNMGLHWAAPSLKSMVPESLWARIQSTQVDPHYPTGKDITIPFSNGETGEMLSAIKMDDFYRLHRNRLRALLAEGLDVQEGKVLTNITYADGGESITAHFADGTSDTGSFLVGSDGPKSTVRRLLLGSEEAKTQVLDYASTMCFTKYTREQAEFLRSPPAHPIFQVSSHPKNLFAYLGLQDAPNPDKPEDWIFFHFISFHEPRDLINEKSKAELVAHQKQLGSLFADPFKSAFDWMPDNADNVWYGKMNQWDPGEAKHRWNNHAGRITLAGDAAHPMTYLRGQGLNHAVTDAVKLCEALAEIWRGEQRLIPEERERVISAYESEMIARGGEEVRLSAKNTAMLHDWEQVLQSPLAKRGLNKGK